MAVPKDRNIFGRRGAGPFAGYPSLNAYRVARRAERLAEVAERIEAIEAGEARQSASRDAHYRAWIDARCVVSSETAPIAIEASTAALLADYREFYARRANSAQAWGRWMCKHYLRVARNVDGVGRVYLGIALRPTPDN